MNQLQTLLLWELMLALLAFMIFKLEKMSEIA
jgi:hypothetical protein